MLLSQRPATPGLATRGERAARDWYGATKGWVAHGYTDIWQDARALGENKWALCVTCGAWAALALSDASDDAPGDEETLRSAIAVLGGAVEFFDESLRSWRPSLSPVLPERADGTGDGRAGTSTS